MIAAVQAEEGSGTPLVYVPGIDGSGALLLDTAPRLARAFRLVRLRYLPQGGDSYAGLAASIDGLLAERGIERALLLSESFGGAVALQLALDWPGRVAGLAIVNGFARHPWRLRLLVSWLGAPLVRGWVFRAARRFLSPSALFGPRSSAPLRARFAAVGGIGLDQAYRRRLQMIRGLDLRPRLPRLACPLALYASDADRIVPSLRAAREMQALAPDATLEVLARAGHLVLPLPEEPWVERLQALAERAGLTAACTSPDP